VYFRGVFQESDGDAAAAGAERQWRLDWLPRRLNENVKLVLTLSDEDLLHELRRDLICSAQNLVQVCSRPRRVVFFSEESRENTLVNSTSCPKIPERQLMMRSCSV